MKYRIKSDQHTDKSHGYELEMPPVGSIIRIQDFKEDDEWMCTDGWFWHPDDLERVEDEAPPAKPSSLRVTVTDKTEHTDLPPTPFLARCGEDVIIVQNYNSVHFEGVGIAGTVIGEYADTWNREAFDPFHGIVTLES